MGRNVGAVSGYAFSRVLGQLDDIVWSPSTLAWFVANPNEFAPGTTMPSQDLDREETRAIVDFIARQQGEGVQAKRPGSDWRHETSVSAGFIPEATMSGYFSVGAAGPR